MLSQSHLSNIEGLWNLWYCKNQILFLLINVPLLLNPGEYLEPGWRPKTELFVKIVNGM